MGLEKLYFQNFSHGAHIMLTLSDLMFEPKISYQELVILTHGVCNCRYVHNNCINCTASALCLCMFGYLHMSYSTHDF